MPSSGTAVNAGGPNINNWRLGEDGKGGRRRQMDFLGSQRWNQLSESAGEALLSSSARVFPSAARHLEGFEISRHRRLNVEAISCVRKRSRANLGHRIHRRVSRKQAIENFPTDPQGCHLNDMKRLPCIGSGTVRGGRSSGWIQQSHTLRHQCAVGRRADSDTRGHKTGKLCVSHQEQCCICPSRFNLKGWQIW